MSTDIAITHVPTNDDIYWPVDFRGDEGSTTTIAGLFAEHDKETDAVLRLSGLVRESSWMEQAIPSLLAKLSDDGAYVNAVSILEALKDCDSALKAVDASYWDRVLRLTDVYDMMPQARRDTWDAAIKKRQTPPFCPDTVAATMRDLLGSRRKFFAERVDGVFRALSPAHLTNRPNGFRERMIFQGITSYGMVDYRSAGHLHDLRCVIATLLGRPHPSSNLTFSLIDFAVNRNRGAWIDVDAGVFRLRAFKKGTVHVEIEDGIARKMNGVLAYLHPRAIPPEHLIQREEKRKPSVVLQRHPIHPAVLSMIRDMRIVREPPEGVCQRWGFNIYDVDKFRIAAFAAAMAGLGGVVDTRTGLVDFDYQASDALGLLAASGMLPDEKSHQFYATPPEIAEKVAKIANLSPSSKVLEPSAGIGSLVDVVICPQERDRLLCLEIDPLRVSVLKAKGYNALQTDFLEWSPEDGAFDRILMNPPFSEKRWQKHFDHACKLLSPGGCVVAVLPESASDYVRKQGGFVETDPIPFPGTAIRVVVVSWSA